jgi:hypothetical protein
MKYVDIDVHKKQSQICRSHIVPGVYPRIHYHEG